MQTNERINVKSINIKEMNIKHMHENIQNIKQLSIDCIQQECPADNLFTKTMENIPV